MDTDQPEDDLFERLLGEDFDVLKNLYDALDREINELAAKEKEIADRRARLEVRRAIINSIGRLHTLERNERMHGHAGRADDNPSTPMAVRLLLDRDPSELWDAPSMHERLAAEGIESTLANVRVALQRLTNTGDARRVGRGTYQSILGEQHAEKPGRDAQEPLLR